jgi:hypothetical protein
MRFASDGLYSNDFIFHVTANADERERPKVAALRNDGNAINEHTHATNHRLEVYILWRHGFLTGSSNTKYMHDVATYNEQGSVGSTPRCSEEHTAYLLGKLL